MPVLGQNWVAAEVGFRKESDLSEELFGRVFPGLLTVPEGKASDVRWHVVNPIPGWPLRNWAGSVVARIYLEVMGK